MISIDRLKEIFDENITNLPHVDATAEIIHTSKRRLLRLVIGPRDIDIDEDGNVAGSGYSFCGKNCDLPTIPADDVKKGDYITHKEA
jgi:hypothetical protein